MSEQSNYELEFTVTPEAIVWDGIQKLSFIVDGGREWTMELSPMRTLVWRAKFAALLNRHGCEPKVYLKQRKKTRSDKR